MRLQPQALLIAAATVGHALDYPATVELGLVFPQNDTYNNITNFPVVLAVKNAEAAFDWGYDLSWRIKGPNISMTAATGTVYVSGDAKPPPGTVDNLWVIADTASNATILRPGTYQLEWSMRTTSCMETGKRIIIQSGVSARGNMHFSLVSDGSGAAVSLTNKCPVYQDRFTAGRSTKAGCPVMTADKSNEEPDGCSVFSLDDEVAACVMSNLTGEGDGGACAELHVREDGDGMAARDIGLRLGVLVGATFAVGLYVL